MTEENKQVNTVPAEAAKPVEAKTDARDGGLRGRGDRQRRERRAPRREPRAKPEFDQKIINIRRVARVVTGGRRFSFSVALIAGNRKGQVGVGLGKAGDTSLAIDKALRHAKKHMIKVSLTKTNSIPHEVSAKYASARVTLTPAPNRGTLVGSSVRTVVELAGIKDVRGKLYSRTKNGLNNARAAIKALTQLKGVRVKEEVK